MSNELENYNDYSKTFLQKKEGKIGAVIGLITAGAGAFWVLSNIAWITALLTNVVTAVALGAVIVGFLYVVADTRLRSALWYLYQMGVTRAIEALWRSDPISVAWSYLIDLKKYRAKMEQQIENLRGQITSLAQMIGKNKEKIESSAASARQAEKMGKQQVMALKARSAGRLEQSNVRLEDARKFLDKLYNALIKMHEVSGVIITDTEEQIQEQTQMFKTMRGAAAAFQSAAAIIRGDKDKKFIFDGAMEFMAQDIAMKAGEIQSFMDMSRQFLDGVDIDNAVFEEKGIDLFNQWAEKNTLLLDDKSKGEFSPITTSTSKKEGVKVRSSRYSGLLD